MVANHGPEHDKSPVVSDSYVVNTDNISRKEQVLGRLGCLALRRRPGLGARRQAATLAARRGLDADRYLAGS